MEDNNNNNNNMNNDKKRSAASGDNRDNDQKRSRVTQEQEELLAEFLVWLKEAFDNWPGTLDQVPDKFRCNAQLIDFLRSPEKFGPAWTFRIASESLRNNKDFILEAIKECPHLNLEYAPVAFRDDAEVVLSAVEHGHNYIKYHDESWYGKLLQFASNRLRADKEFIKQVLEKHASELRVVAPELQDDPDVFASERLRSNKDFIRQAMKLDYYAFFFVTKDLLINDTDFTVELLSTESTLLDSMHENGEIEEYLTRDTALKLVQVKGSAMYHFPDAWKADREIVLAALASCTWIFKEASKELQADREFVWEAIKISGSVYKWASEALKADRKILLEVLRQDGGDILQYAPQHFWRDAEVVQTAVTNGSRFHVGQELADEQMIVLEAVKDHHHILQSASARLRADPEIVLEAVKFDSYALRFAHPDLRSNRDIISAAVQQDGHLLELATDNLKMDIEVVVLAVRNEPFAMRHVQDTVRHHPRVVGAMLRSTEASSIYFSRQVRSQLLLAISAIEQQHKWDGHLGSPVSRGDELGEEEGSAVRRFVEHWKRGMRHKSWLLKQRLDVPGVVRLILEYGMQKEFQDVEEVVRLAPIFAAFADRGINWNGIPMLLKW